MPASRWNTRAKRAREASVREQEQLLDSLLQPQSTELPDSQLRLYRELDAGVFPQNATVYPFRFGSDPFSYYRYTPYYFGGQGHQGQQGRQPVNVVPQTKTSQRGISKVKSQKKIATQKSTPADGRTPEGSYYPNMYGYYPYPTQSGYPGYYPYPYANPNPYGYSPTGQSYLPQQPQAPPGPPPPEPSESNADTGTVKSGMMSVDGRRPLFLVALFVVSIAVLLVSFPLTLLSAGYIGPLGLMFATGPFATVFAFWAIYLTPCECYPNVEWATSRIRVFATTAAVFDAVGTIGVPISMYGAQCPDDDDTMLGCEDELPAAKGISMAVAVVLGTHCFLCLLVRSNARKLAESKFGDERTEGITLAPTPFDRTHPVPFNA